MRKLIRRLVTRTKKRSQAGGDDFEFLLTRMTAIRAAGEEVMLALTRHDKDGNRAVTIVVGDDHALGIRISKALTNLELQLSMDLLPLEIDD